MNCPVKTILRFLFQAICLLLVAAGFVAALLASFFVIAMLIVWFQEGLLQTADRKMLGAGVKWLLGAGVLVGVAWWLHRRIVGSERRDDTFKLVESKSGNSEKIAQDVVEILFFVLLAIWLWALNPESTAMKIPSVAGWLVVGFLGKHVRVALHEIGHLGAARLLGFDLRKIQVGTGPLLWSHSFANGLLWEWRAWSQGGFVLATQRNIKGFRVRQSLFIAAGPLVDLVVLWLSYQLITRVFGGLRMASVESAGGLIASVLFWWMALSAVGGLVPHKVWMGHHKLWTDGYWLLKLWTGSHAHLVELARRSDWRGLLELLESDPSRKVISPDAGTRKLPAHLADPRAFHEQQARLSLRLLRERSFTSSPPA